jgi:hypothetical protein
MRPRSPSARGAVLAALCLAGTAGQHAAAAPPEQVVAGIDAVVYACTPIDARSAKAAADLLERARVQHKLDLVALRTSAGYRSTYNAEVNRLLALPAKERLAACQNAG